MVEITLFVLDASKKRVIMSVNSSGTGQAILVTTGSFSFASFLTENATVVSLLLTFLSFAVGAIFLYLNWKENCRHKRQSIKLQERALQLQEQAALRNSLKD